MEYYNLNIFTDSIDFKNIFSFRARAMNFEFSAKTVPQLLLQLYNMHFRSAAFKFLRSGLLISTCLLKYKIMQSPEWLPKQNNIKFFCH